ncbi:hypothetical protein PRIC1_014430 [Phytophthora ramorum]
MCLYTFDDPAVGKGGMVSNRVPDDSCPFDALQPDSELVTSLNTASTSWQLGVRLAEAPNNDTKRVQLSSLSTVSARDFFTMAAVSNNTASGSGVTFELVLRRRAQTNHSMTLVSIANEYDNCVDPGFRLDVNEHQILALIYFLPVLEEGGEAGVEACYEQRLFSVDNSAACQLPPVRDPVEHTPPVQILVALDPSSERGLWKTDFYVSYTDPETMQRVDCEVHDEQHPANTQVLSKLVEGRYRLYLGNSPRNVRSPRERKRLAKARSIQPLGNTSSMNATERLRATLKQKLRSITGPRLPKAMRIFGDNSLSLHIFGITFPPLSEDTPLAYLRSKLADFKEQYGDQLVDYLVNLVQQKSSSSVVVKRSPESSSQSYDLLTPFGQHNKDGDEFTRAALFQGADGATFDLFHFAIYQRVVPKEEVNSIARQWLLPSRQFPSRQQTVRIPEDSLVLLNLTTLHGVFDDLRLELRGLPEFGQLLLFPNKTIVTSDSKDAFRELPVEYQRSIFFRPEPDQNNENLPLPNPVAFSRRLKPYATVSFGISDSLSMRVVNKSEEVAFDIFVAPVNDAPRPRIFELEVRVGIGIPVCLNLTGDDIDGAPVTATPSTGASEADDLLSKFTFSNTTVVTTNRQLLKIVQMPHFGKLFDCNKRCGTLQYDRNNRLSLESSRIYRNSTDATNATHSTSLMYVYRGWGQGKNGNASLVVDELSYQLSDGDPGVFSDVAVVKFVLVDGVNDSVSENVLTSVRLDEDSCQIIHLGTMDPLAALFNSRTHFKVSILPQHGTLFQFNGPSRSGGSTVDEVGVNVSLAFIGSRITAANTIVADQLGRVVYMPELDYFNTDTQPAVQQAHDVDFFEYEVLNSTQPANASFAVNENSPTARYISGSVARRVTLEVVNVPDALVVFPPFSFTANVTPNTDIVSTPVAFEDPDSIHSDELYQVNLEAADSTSEFEFGFAITDDDILTDCPLQRPCTLVKSTHGASSDVSSASSRDSELQFSITSQLYDASHIQVTGTRSALTTALSALAYRDLSGFSPGIEHTAEFTLWVKRVGAALQTETTFTINFLAASQSSTISSGGLVSVMNSKLEQFVSTFFVLIAGWLVLSYASCLSTGFCCCCCSKARKKRREKFEQEQQIFQTQVAQNDHEYSVLLMSLADILLEPNLLASISLLESCVTPTSHQSQTDFLRQAFVLRSLLPLLESERQGTRFVSQLMAIEYSEGIGTTGTSQLFFQRQGFLSRSSTASKALACFCRLVGSEWMSAVVSPNDGTKGCYLGDTISELHNLLDRLAKHVDALPAEIVILSRACVKLFQTADEDEKPRELELDAMHLVFFNHFLGPALLFLQDCVPKFSPSLKQQQILYDVACRIVGLSKHWSNFGSERGEMRARSSSTDSLLRPFAAETENTAECRHKYEEVLLTISQSSATTSSYDPSHSKADVDCELMGMCLMNMHSLLDSYFPAFKRRLRAHTSMNDDQTEATVTRMARLLQALSWPLASIQELVEYAQPELLKDPLLWSDFSFQEWEDRAAQDRPNLQQPTTDRRITQSHQSLLAQFSSDFILEQDDNSPSDVDWLTS